MTNFELLSFFSPEELAEAAAQRWLATLQGAATEKPYCVALSGGRIARQLFSAVVKQAKAQRIKWDAVHFFWGDERCVPPADPESNFGIARLLLLQPLAIPEGQIHRIHGEDPPDFAANEAAAELCRTAPSSPNQQPLLDLIFLGMGEDGHVASLFPGEPDEIMSVYRAVTASKPPPRRITLGYATIAVARQVWVLASGSGKKDALRQSLSPSAQTPLARIISARHHTRIFSDISI